MNILLVSSYLPFPLFSGGHIRLYNIIKELSKKHSITLICEQRAYQGKSEIEELEKFCKKVITVPREKQWTLGNVLKTGFSLSPFLITGHTSKRLRRGIEKELNENQFDLIHVETSYVIQNIPSTPVPIVLVEHNVEYLVYKRFADNAPLLVKPLLYADVIKLKVWEEKMWKRVSRLVAVSEVEKVIMKNIRKDVDVVSNGVDVDKFKHFKKKSGNGKTLLFIGEFKWMQNRDAIEWVLREIWSKLKSEVIPSMTDKGLKLWVVGRHIPVGIKKMITDKNVVFDENAPRDTEEIFKKSDVLLAPIRVGGGTSFKILEAMASGVPVVTTDLGNAIGAKDNEEILIAKDTNEFVENVRKLFEDTEFYEKISENARKLVEKKYNWKKITDDLNNVYESVVYHD